MNLTEWRRKKRRFAFSDLKWNKQVRSGQASLFDFGLPPTWLFRTLFVSGVTWRTVGMMIIPLAKKSWNQTHLTLLWNTAAFCDDQTVGVTFRNTSNHTSRWYLGSLYSGCLKLQQTSLSWFLLFVTFLFGNQHVQRFDLHVQMINLRYFCVFYSSCSSIHEHNWLKKWNDVLYVYLAHIFLCHWAVFFPSFGWCSVVLC